MNIENAKFRLYNTMPFFGTILFQLPIVRDDTIPTMGVDGESLYYNQKFWDSLPSPQQLGLLCHEVGHLVLGHIWRQKHRKEMAVNPQTGQTVTLWNLAGDFVINEMITADDACKTGKVALPKPHLIDKKYTGWSTEAVYEDLRKRMEKAKSGGGWDIPDKAGVCDKSRWGKGSKGKKKKKQEAKWKAISKQAAEVAKAQGKLPAHLQRIMGDMEPKEDWRQILLSYVLPFVDDYSFSPADRRYLEEDFILPDIRDGQKIDWVAVAVDTSGSIGDKELKAFIGEIRGIMHSYDRVKIKLTFCDTAPTPFEELQEFDESRIKPKGGGGTDFRPVFNLIEKEGSEPLALIYFTDTYGTFPSKAPDYDVIWIAETSFGKVEVPWGKLLPYKV